MARTPAAKSTSRPSGKGKKASDAAAAPRARSSPARDTASRAASTRLTWPMPMPTAAPSLASRIALDFGARTARQAKARSSIVAASTAEPATRRQVAGSSPSALRSSAPWSKTPPEIGRRSTQPRSGRGWARRIRKPLRSPRMLNAASSYPGATTTSVKTSAIASAMAAVTGLLAATTPPNADTGSVAKDFS